jgi:hypothetical protein
MATQTLQRGYVYSLCWFAEKENVDLLKKNMFVFWKSSHRFGQ